MIHTVEQNGHTNVNDIVQCILLRENENILIRMLKFDRKDPINHMSALV